MFGKQLDLFKQSGLNVNVAVKKEMAVAALQAKARGLDRKAVLSLMNSLADAYGVHLMGGNSRGLSMTMFEKWLNPRAKGYTPSLNALLVFCVAVEDISPMQALIKPMGAQIIDEQDSLMLQWAKEHHRAKDAQKKMKKLAEQF